MKPLSSSDLDRPVLLVDRQRARREHYAAALRAQGFQIYACDSAHAPLLLNALPQTMLVVLNCSYIGQEEERVVREILERHYHLLVLCDTVSIPMIRILFLQGVDDVADQPRTPEHLVGQIHEVLINLVPRNSYQAVEREISYGEKETYSGCR